MWIYVWDSEIKWIYLWDTPVKEVYLWDTKIRPMIQPFWDTITITWTETSDPTQFNPVWSDWADWAVAWDTRFDERFWYYACHLNPSWVESDVVTQEASWWSWNLDMTRIATRDWSDWKNVMIAFPIRWVKMSKSWSTVTLSMTKKLNETWYQYYAFNRNWTPKSILYLWAYKAAQSTEWWVQYLRSYSWIWAAYINNLSLDNACYLAQRNPWYDEITWYQRQYINAMYMMKYWNPNAQDIVWCWNDQWSAQATWTTDNILTATWATDKTSFSWHIKLFWLEDRWGNIGERANWTYCNTTWTLLISSSQNFPSGRITSFDKSFYIPWWFISSIVWTNDWMFVMNGGWWWTSTYYCDYVQQIYKKSSYLVWGFYGRNNYFWPFYARDDWPQYWSAQYWWRLMYLQP